MPFPEKVSFHDLIQAALHVLDREQTLSLQAVAKRLRVKPPSLYRHVSSLRGLEEKAAAEGYRLVGIQMQEALAAKRSWLSVASAYRRFALSHPALYRLMTGPRGRAREGTEALKVVTKPVADLLGVDQDSEEYLLRHRPAWAFIHGFVSLELEDQFLQDKRAEIEEAFRLGVKMLERTLSRPKGRGKPA